MVSLLLFAASEHPTLEDLFNERQLKAIELAKEKEIQASDLRELFPQVTRKTISRDLGELVEKGLLIKKGKEKELAIYLPMKVNLNSDH